MLKYIEGTLNFGIMYGNANEDSECPLIGFSNSKFATCIDKRKFISCYMFLVFTSIISWKIFLQHVVVLSTTKAKYIIVIKSMKERISLHGLLKEFVFHQ